MAHYSFLDENNIVVKVLTGVDEDDLSTLPKEFKSWEEFYEDQQGLKCVRTSYNTKLGQHSDPDKEPLGEIMLGSETNMMKTWTYSFPQRIGIAGSKIQKTSAESSNRYAR